VTGITASYACAHCAAAHRGGDLAHALYCPPPGPYPRWLRQKKGRRDQSDDLGMIGSVGFDGIGRAGSAPANCVEPMGGQCTGWLAISLSRPVVRNDVECRWWPGTESVPLLPLTARKLLFFRSPRSSRCARSAILWHKSGTNFRAG